MKLKEFLQDTARGAGIGIAAIIPGVSGGSMAVIFGVYEKLVGAIHGLFKNFVKSVLILLPVVFGIAIGFMAAIFPIKAALEHCMLLIVSLFAGLIAGSVPDLTKKIFDQKPKVIEITIGVLATLIAIGIGVLSILLKTNTKIDAIFETNPWYLYLILIGVGFVAACGFVIPGISGSMLMMIMGFYDNLINLITNVVSNKNVGQSLAYIGCAAIGVIGGFLIISIIMDILFKKYPRLTNWAIIGFVIGSVIAIFMSSDLINYVTAKNEEGVYLIKNWELICAPFSVIMGFAISYLFVKLINKKQTEQQIKETTNA